MAQSSAIWHTDVIAYVAIYVRALYKRFCSYLAAYRANYLGIHAD